uniref:Uncharacterized protein n=1 Tax=Caulobacter sp. (strain K31) TaxID=366602 RepID=B0T9A9_CAUSK
MSNTSCYDLIDRDLIAAHIASGQPRYSNTLYLRGGGFIRHWSDDRDEVLARHARSVSDAKLSWTITFDHLAVQDLAVDFPPHDKTAAQLKAECDQALDEMMDRWLADACG